MIVVSDTGPVNYLILIGHVDILKQLYGKIILPNAVHTELIQTGAPEVVRQWAQSPPAWVDVVSITTPILELGLDLGEQEAITLALEMGANAILMDEKLGRAAAATRKVPVIGTLGILDAAASRGFLDLSDAISHLQETTFRVNKHIIEMLLANDTLRQKLH